MGDKANDSGEEAHNVDSLETRVAILEEKLESLPPREWVKDFVRPLQDSITEISNAVKSLASKAESLFTAHNELLREKSVADKKLIEERTASGMAKKWGPVISMLGACFLVYQVISTLITSWLKARGF
jgi:hypothetical protein